MGIAVHLTAATDRKGRFSGYYKCSVCEAEFRPNPECPGELSKTFDSHAKYSHSDSNTEDVSSSHRKYRRKKYRGDL